MLFEVKSANRYEDAQDSKKVVQISILDVVFDNKVSDLIYMRDVTHLVKKPDAVVTSSPELSEHEEIKNESKTSTVVTQLL